MHELLQRVPAQVALLLQDRCDVGIAAGDLDHPRHFQNRTHIRFLDRALHDASARRDRLLICIGRCLEGRRAVFLQLLGAIEVDHLQCAALHAQRATAVARADDAGGADDDVVIGVLKIDRPGAAEHQVARAGDELTSGVESKRAVALADAELAFKPLSPVKFNIDQLETNPRFAAISRPANAAILVRLRIDMEDRGGTIELLLPYATIEPIREVLLQMFMGEKFGRDPTWEGHLATEIGQAEIAVSAVLYEALLPLRQIMKLDVGDTLMLDLKSDAPVIVRCGDVMLTEGRMGRVGGLVAVRVGKPLRKPNTTLAMFETAGGVGNRMEGQ